MTTNRHWKRTLCAAAVLAVFALAAAAAADTDKGAKHSADETDDDPVIGIDLGTTYSCVAVLGSNGKVTVIPNEQGSRVTPSYVAYTASGERLAGDAAKNQASMRPGSTIFDAKRLIGRPFDDPTVQRDRKLLPYKVVSRKGKAAIEVPAAGDGPARVMSPEEVSAVVLGDMKATAEAFLGRPVRRAVVTVPAYFNDAQRQATKDAGTIAGLDVMRIISEPTAAALSYGLDRRAAAAGPEDEYNVLVYDLGGGTFDVSLLTVDDGVFEVLATAGDTHLGGEDFDARVVEHLAKAARRQLGVDVRQDKRALAKLRREAERAKRALSAAPSTRVEVDALHDGRDFSETLTRAKFEELAGDLLRKTLKPVERVLRDAGVAKRQVDEVLLVGGSTRIPMVRRLLRDFFNGKEPADGVNPDEAVASGAAVQAALLGGRPAAHLDDVVVMQVTPLSLGIETAGGVMHTILERNTQIPTRRAQVYTTSAENQPAVLIQVYQGERARTRDNTRLGQFELDGIAPAPRGVPQIKVEFEVDVNGILHVTATDEGTGRVNNVTVTADKGRLSQDEIARLVLEAEEHAEEDRAVKAAASARSNAEGVAYRMRGQAASADGVGASLDDEDREQLKEASSDLIEWLEENRDADADEINERLAQFEGVTGPIMRRAYSSSGGGGGGGDDGGDEDMMDDEEDL